MRLLLAVLLTTVAVVHVGRASITGSKHDFAEVTGNWAEGETCKPCHTPHNAMVLDADGVKVGGPLWNHELSIASYTLYSDWQDPLATPVEGEVDTNSRVCLSCHDGTVALDSFGGNSGMSTMGGDANLGTDLSDDHPIGEEAVWAERSYMVSQTLRDDGHTMPLRPLADGRLAVGCTSCHEPHNRRDTEHMTWFPMTGGTTLDGRVVNGSLLCQNCHKK